MKKFLLALSVFFLTACLLPLTSTQAETLHFTTYYPSPAGNYDRVRLVPRVAPTGACDEGLMYYDSTDHSAKICGQSQTFGPLGGAWLTEAGDIGGNTFTFIYPENTATDSNINVGIGTTTPEFRLTLDDDGGILAKGILNDGLTLQNLTVSPSGQSIFLWYPRKGAFRAGGLYPGNYPASYEDPGAPNSGTQWNNNNTGEFSVAMGEGPVAQGWASIALGHYTHASGLASIAIGTSTWAPGDHAMALGFHTHATGVAATSMGWQTQSLGHGSTSMGVDTIAAGLGAVAMGRSQTRANGNESLATGNGTIANGNASVSMGSGTVAQSFASLAMGRFNTVSGSATSWNAGDPAFVIGDGTNTSSRSNALTILKNGSVRIGNGNPQVMLDVDGEVRVGSSGQALCVQGSIRYEGGQFQGCTPSGWRSLGGGCQWKHVQTILGGNGFMSLQQAVDEGATGLCYFLHNGTYIAGGIMLRNGENEATLEATLVQCSRPNIQASDPDELTWFYSCQ